MIGSYAENQFPPTIGHHRKISLAYGRGTGIPSPVDVHVGARVRIRRTLLGLSQTNLGDAIGLTFQQVQKYERGTNRMGSSRLYDVARILDVPVRYFFEEMPAEVAANSPAQRRRTAKGPPDNKFDPLVKRETLELVRAYYKISDTRVRNRLYEMVKALGAAASSSD